jgi:hypothetical protein
MHMCDMHMQLGLYDDVCQQAAATLAVLTYRRVSWQVARDGKEVRVRVCVLRACAILAAVHHRMKQHAV